MIKGSGSAEQRPASREDLLEWSEKGLLQPQDFPRACQLAGLTPQPADWRQFIDALLLWLGVILVSSSVIFFFAYNWRNMDRFLKFGLVEVLLAAAVAAGFWLGVGQQTGKAALLTAALLTGALFALVGQTYQTGADPYELFLTWALFILPWVAVARFEPLWLLWIALLNVAATMYFTTAQWGLLGFLFGGSGIAWTLFMLNVVALGVWEFLLVKGVTWLHRWGARIVATLAGTFATGLGTLAVVDGRAVGFMALPVYLLWMLAIYFYYRHRMRDVFVLAGGVLSAVIVVTVFLGKNFLRHSDAGGYLLIGLVIIAMSGGGAWWIRQLVQEQPT